MTDCEMFQTLKGSLQTGKGRSERSDKWQFQTLKGSLQTPSPLHRTPPSWDEFQTLKGSLQTAWLNLSLPE